MSTKVWVQTKGKVTPKTPLMILCGFTLCTFLEKRKAWSVFLYFSSSSISTSWGHKQGHLCCPGKSHQPPPTAAPQDTHRLMRAFTPPPAQPFTLFCRSGSCIQGMACCSCRHTFPWHSHMDRQTHSNCCFHQQIRSARVLWCQRTAHQACKHCRAWEKPSIWRGT